jgi:hypothetical protein
VCGIIGDIGDIGDFVPTLSKPELIFNFSSRVEAEYGDGDGGIIADVGITDDVVCFPLCPILSSF